MERRGCGQSNLHSIEILDDSTVFTDIVILVAIEHLRFAHFPIQNVSTMCLIDYNQIIVGNRWHGVTFGIKNALYEALNCCDMYLGFFVDLLFIQTLDVVNRI